MTEQEKNTTAENAENVQPDETQTPTNQTEEVVEETKTEEEAPIEEVKAEATPVEETKTEEKPEEEKEFVFDQKPKKDLSDYSTKDIKPLDDFNWDLIGKREESYTKEQREELENMYNRTLSTVSEGEVFDGTVVAMDKREVVVNIGYKSEGVINANEFRYTPDLKLGDTVEVYVENMEDADGQLLLSHNKAKALRSWERVNTAFEQDEIIKGYIKCRTKGGMIVDVFGIEAFLPGSQIDVKPIRDYDIYVDKVMEFKVVKINNEFKNVVVSHKALIEAELEEQKKEIISKLEKGQVLEGTVKNITSYGVFIDLGGIDGLIHITDLSWGRVNHPEEIVTLDEKINVVILDFDDDKKRIALGLKQLTQHPWDSLDENLKVGDKVTGKVVVLADYGAFIEISTGVEGLIHVSEMSWSQHLRSANEFMKVGDDVEAIILTLDREERKMSLGIKQLYPDPWEKIEEKYPVNSKHSSKVRNFTNFGIFVELEEGVDGLVHISDLSWTKKIKHPAEFTAIGAELEVVVLEIDKENRRLSLGHKQVEENPWEVFETIFSVDSIHEGTIIEMNDKGAVIALPYGVEGFATPRHLVKEDGVQAKAEEKIDFKVIEFNKDAKKIFVSHSRIHEDEKREKVEEERRTKQKESGETSKRVRGMGEKIERTTIGDMVNLKELKKELEIQEKQAKADAVEEAQAEQPVENITPTEEVKVEETPVEEVKASEETPATETEESSETETKE
ncbi:MAG: 30S ribosomal protein S1 [Bacteroidales bacterium]|nr:30S ribosomal protein S1 [Bacteroidales bacterium]